MADVRSSHSRWAGPFERHTRSLRITDDIWERFKPLLCALYRSYTLTVVMTFMKKRFGFRASKRQYGYRFEKWGIKKYNAGEKKASTGALATLGDDEHMDLADMVALLTKDNHAFNTSSLLSLPNSRALSPSVVSDDTENDDSSLVQAMPQDHIIYPWEAGAREETYKLAAEFCAAMSDDENAFALYSDVYKSLAESPISSSGTKKFIAISCARVAGRTDNATQARELLSKQYKLQKSNRSDPNFVLVMLRTCMGGYLEQADKADKAEAMRRVCDHINRVLCKNGSLVHLPHCYSAIDLVTYFYLSYGFDVYEQVCSEEFGRGLAPELLLNEYVTNQPFIEAIRNGGLSPLLSCVQWCSEQLNRDLEIPLQDAAMRPTPATRCWWNNIMIFCTLWDAMLRLVRNDRAPDWYDKCESAFGISPSELLATLSWMIGAETTRSDHDANADADVLGHAVKGARALVDLKESELWVKFLDKFAWMNELVDPDVDEKEFEALVLCQLRRHVSKALGIRLPFPAESQPSAVPELDIIGGYEYEQPYYDQPDFDFGFLNSMALPQPSG
ncbi:hypothetical protein FZEAL_7917 [Fusarium zealandicum]|uniref:Clr5 domain-containing protein n=1 Tax=Fusarium zealandicum TaxID=1053134 RepID=A0A8H4UF50_9HYPO|nr:hypothetical protein FZEAL_7917 [Fusarium zealandicum]